MNVSQNLQNLLLQLKLELPEEQLEALPDEALQAFESTLNKLLSENPDEAQLLASLGAEETFQAIDNKDLFFTDKEGEAAPAAGLKSAWISFLWQQNAETQVPLETQESRTSSLLNTTSLPPGIDRHWSDLETSDEALLVDQQAGNGLPLLGFALPLEGLPLQAGSERSAPIVAEAIAGISDKAQKPPLNTEAVLQQFEEAKQEANSHEGLDVEEFTLMGADKSASKSFAASVLFSERGLQSPSESSAKKSSVDQALLGLGRLESTSVSTVIPALGPATSATQPVLQLTPVMAHEMPQMAQQLGERLMLMVDARLNHAELRLDPPHLGELDIHMKLEDDRASILIQAANPQARELLDAAAQRLREILQQSGYAAVDVDVSGKDAQQQSAAAKQDADGVSEGVAEEAGLADEPSAAAARHSFRPGVSLDVFV